VKNHNIPILLIVVALVAVAAQLTRPKPAGTPGLDATERDLATCLRLLWQQEGQEVKLQPLRDGYVLQAGVTMARGTRLRQQRWNHPFLRFAASRHPEIPISEIEVRELGNNNLIPQNAMNGLMADRIAPRAEGGDEERAAILTGRQLTAELDGLLGSGHCLVLVDALATSSQAGEIRYGKRAFAPPEPRGAFDYVVWVVSKGAIPAEQWQGFLRNTSMAGIRNPRQVVLP
jgi:hypothetical protein